jgi:hypothetical protein
MAKFARNSKIDIHYKPHEGANVGPTEKKREKTTAAG